MLGIKIFKPCRVLRLDLNDLGFLLLDRPADAVVMAFKRLLEKKALVSLQVRKAIFFLGAGAYLQNNPLVISECCRVFVFVFTFRLVYIFS